MNVILSRSLELLIAGAILLPIVLPTGTLVGTVIVCPPVLFGLTMVKFS